MTEIISILIIDDSQDDRLFYKRELQKNSDKKYAISEVDSGEDILQALATQQPSCILLDYSLPGHNGIDVLKFIRSNYQYIPVIMLTGQGNEAVAVSAIQEGAQNYISKSNINSESLQRIVTNAIEHCALHKRIDEQRLSLEIFTRALAHDLKEPMRTISSFTDIILKNNQLPEKLEGYFKHIKASTSRMTMLIDTVFHYTQLDAQDHMMKESFDLNVVLKETMENLNHLINEYHAEIITEHLPRVYANRVQMLQVCQNLIANAIRHGGMKVKIYVTAKDYPDYWQFSVQDNGPGIEPEYHNKIFMPFKRLSGAKEEGAGLGLAICKKAIDLHGGEIWCRSKPGTGATFMFTLPRDKTESDNISSIATVLSPASQSVDNYNNLANILLVDDRESDLEFARILLLENAHLQCNMMIAHDGNEALDALRGEIIAGREIDLLLLDINMPGMDGFELLEHMRNDKSMKNISVVMCTGSIYEKDKQRSEELGAIGYMIKPLSFENIKPMFERVPNIRLYQTDSGYTLQRMSN